MAWHTKLHWRIIIGLGLGIVFGVIAAANGWGQFTNDWISPFGTIFLNLRVIWEISARYPMPLAGYSIGLPWWRSLEPICIIVVVNLGDLE